MLIYSHKIIDDIVKNFFDNRIIKKNDIIVIGVSGGIDSMCLLDVFYKLSFEFNFEIIAMHIHHGIRGIDADNDLSFVEKYCNDFSIKFIKKHVDAIKFSNEKKVSLEEAARFLRYKEFEKTWINITKKEAEVDTYILVAHHMKDQAETILHNMIRGTGIVGLRGMKMKSSYILRPLLNFSKDEIEDYANYFEIPYVVDYTNNDLNYTRNYIRKNIINDMIKINQKAILHIFELSKEVGEVIDYIDMLTDYLMKKMSCKNNNIIKIDINLFRNTPHILQTYIIRKILQKLSLTLKDITRVHIEDCILLSDKCQGKHLDLPYNITVDKTKEYLIFTLNKINVSMSKKNKL